MSKLVWQRNRDGPVDEEPKGPSQLQQQLESTDKSSVGFLYNKQELDKEAYLTGKKIDKDFVRKYLAEDNDNFEASLNPHKNDGPIRESDLGRKVREDPFALVKEKEAERLKKLRANPQKMARMKKIMDAYLQANKEDAESSEEESPKKRSKSRRNRSRSRSSDRKHRRRSDDRSRKRSRDKRRSRSRSRSRSKSKEARPGYGLILPGGKKVEKKNTTDEKYKSEFAKFRTQPEGYRRKEKHGFTKKLTAEEKAKRLAEMSSNAEWRDETRKSRVKKGREMDEKEEQAVDKNDHSYYRKIKMAATDKSLEERVKARGSANQKTASALNKNWTKR